MVGEDLEETETPAPVPFSIEIEAIVYIGLAISLLATGLTILTFLSSRSAFTHCETAPLWSPTPLEMEPHASSLE